MESAFHFQGDAFQRGAAAAARAVRLLQGGRRLRLVDLAGEVKLVEENLVQTVRDVFLLHLWFVSHSESLDVGGEENGEHHKRESETEQG